MTMEYAWMESPIGPILVAGDENGLAVVQFGDALARWQPAPGWREGRSFVGDAMAQLADYFRGRTRQFELRLAPSGTAFQQRVWRALAEIPYGETLSYGALAARIGRPTAARPVGAANGRNPIGIIIPCHRVIGASGALTGYGGGLDAKRWLLDLERGQPSLH
jgi:methylated-DNA-[protein]-cysteine S-methyltransferase